MSALVGGKRFGPPLDGNLVETRLDDGQLRAVRGRIELEHNECGGLLRIIDARIHRVRMPSKGEQSHRLDAINRELETNPFVLFLALRDFRIDGCRNDLSNNTAARDERPVKLDPEPTAELLRVAN